MPTSGEIYETFNSVKELLGLRENNLLSIPKIEWWLLKYSDLYKQTNQETRERINSPNFELPYTIGDHTPEEKFSNLYKELDTLCNYYRKEQNLADKISEYSLIRKVDKNEEAWQTKNEEYFLKNYSSFLLDYLDYQDDPIYLSVFLFTMPKVDIFIEKEYFVKTLDYIEIMHSQYS